MRTLIITTGCAKVILTRLIPMLKERGKYEGDILVIDYGTMIYTDKAVTVNNKEPIEALKQMKGVTVLQPVRKLSTIFTDRLVVGREYLRKHKKDYDVVMFLDGNDVLIWGSIQPLLDMASKEICVVQEHPSNLLKIWNDFYLRDFIMKSDYKSIENNPIINAGMFVGPITNVIEIIDGIMDLIKVFGDACSDQAYLDILLYYYKYPHRLVGDEWNYTHAVIGTVKDGNSDRMVFIKPRVPIFKDNKAYKKEDGTPVYIEHRTGTGHRIWAYPAGIRLLESDAPIPIMTEYKPSNWLFPDIQPDNTQPPSKSNWLFK